MQVNKPVSQDRLAALRRKIDDLRLVESRELCEENFTEFVKQGWSSIDSSEYAESWAVDAMCDHLEAVTLGHIRRLLINISPRCAKTTVCSVLWNAWTWARSDISYLSGPQVRFLCASYGASLALESSTRTRRLIYSPWYQARWGQRFFLTEDQNTKNQFDNTKGGSRRVTSVGGSLLGLGGDIEIADDLNNTEDVESEAERENVTRFWNEFHTTRLNNQRLGAIVAVQQRLDAGDVSGTILDSDEDWVHLMIPMRYDPARHCVTVRLPQYDDEEPWEDPRTEEDELMWEERFPLEAVKRIEAGLGPYMSSGRLQQSPAPKGGGIIKREWWQPWGEEEAARYGLEWSGGRREFPEMELVVGSLDTAFGEKEENDYNALTIWGIWIDRAKNRRAMLMYAWAKRLPLHGVVLAQNKDEARVNFEQRQREALGLVEWVADTCKRYKVRRLLIEDKTRGRDVAQEINRIYVRDNWGVELIPVNRDKVVRTHSVVTLFTDNCVFAPNTKWAEQVITQCERFPKDDHDDLHDTVTQFLLWSRENGLLLRADEMSAALEELESYRAPTQSVARLYGV